MVDKRAVERSEKISTLVTKSVKDSEDRLRSENEKAHAGITKNIDDVKQDVRMLIGHMLNRAASPEAAGARPDPE